MQELVSYARIIALNHSSTPCINLLNSFEFQPCVVLPSGVFNALAEHRTFRLTGNQSYNIYQRNKLSLDALFYILQQNNCLYLNRHLSVNTIQLIIHIEHAALRHGLRGSLIPFIPMLSYLSVNLK